MLNSLAALIHKNKRNAAAIAKRLCTPDSKKWNDMDCSYLQPKNQMHCALTFLR